jgi:hypothetical protein
MLQHFAPDGRLLQQETLVDINMSMAEYEAPAYGKAGRKHGRASGYSHGDLEKLAKLLLSYAEPS